MLQLTEEQLKVVNSFDGKYVVLAGAGSGKTKVLVERTAKLILEGKVKDEEIMLVTYTNKAADEIRMRLSQKLGRDHKVVVTTFHAYCFKIIRELYPDNKRKKLKVLDDDSKRALIKDLIEKLDLKLEAGEASRIISAIKNKVNLKLNDLRLTLKYIKLFDEYTKYCNDQDYIDYDEMMVKYFELLEHDESFLEMEAESFKFVMVDECQDINQLQMEVLDKITCVHHNIMLVGDIDQAIYRWRGSDSDLIKSFINRPNVKTLTLSINFRSDGYIVTGAEDLITHNQNRIYKQMNPYKQKCVPIYKKIHSDKNVEARFIAREIKFLHELGIPYREIFALVRLKRNTTALEFEFKQQGIPYIVDGLTVSDRKEISLPLRYLDFLLNPNDDRAFLSVLNEPARGIGSAKLNEIVAISVNNKCSYYEAAKHLDDKHVKAFIELTEELITLMNSVEPSIFIDMLIDKIEYKKYISRLSKHLIRLSRFNTLKESLLSFLNGDNTKYRDFLNMYYLSNEKDTTNEDAVRIMTIHQSKGLEAEAVFVTGCNKESMLGLINDPERIEEERNLFYVACTRAKRYLYISVPLKDMDGKTPLKQSPFVNELLERQMIEEKEEKYLYEGLPF